MKTTNLHIQQAQQASCRIITKIFKAKHAVINLWKERQRES